MSHAVNGAFKAVAYTVQDVVGMCFKVSTAQGLIFLLLFLLQQAQCLCHFFQIFIVVNLVALQAIQRRLQHATQRPVLLLEHWLEQVEKQHFRVDV